MKPLQGTPVSNDNDGNWITTIIILITITLW